MSKKDKPKIDEKILGMIISALEGTIPDEWAAKCMNFA